MNLPFCPKCRLGFCAELGIAVHKWKRETLSCVDPHAIYSLSSVFPCYIWRKLNKIIKVKEISTHQTLIRRKTLRFPPSFLKQNVTHRIRVVKKYQDSYHCGRWLHITIHEIFTCETGLQTFKLLLLLWKANLHEMYSHRTGTWKCWTLPSFVVRTWGNSSYHTVI